MIYFVRCEEAVKIGYAGNIHTRVTELQRMNPYRCTLFRSIEGTMAHERWLHAYFWRIRIHSEWFYYNKEMLTIVPNLSINVGRARKETGIAPIRIQLIQEMPNEAVIHGLLHTQNIRKKRAKNPDNQAARDLERWLAKVDYSKVSSEYLAAKQQQLQKLKAG